MEFHEQSTSEKSVVEVKVMTTNGYPRINIEFTPQTTILQFKENLAEKAQCLSKQMRLSNPGNGKRIDQLPDTELVANILRPPITLILCICPIDAKKPTSSIPEEAAESNNSDELAVDAVRQQVRDDYNRWAPVYDTGVNPTRDLEGEALRRIINETIQLGKDNKLDLPPLLNILEVGCGTGKNSAYFLSDEFITTVTTLPYADGARFHHTGIDLSPEMLAIAKQRFITHPSTYFCLGDITQQWESFLIHEHHSFDLIAYSLVLEHIENLDHIFAESARFLKRGGLVYLGELHPIKQYLGTKARFDAEGSGGKMDGSDGTTIVRCFVHHMSDFIHSAEKHGLQLLRMEEFFDDDSKLSANSVYNGIKVPRILALLFQKK